MRLRRQIWDVLNIQFTGRFKKYMEGHTIEKKGVPGEKGETVV